MGLVCRLCSQAATLQVPQGYCPQGSLYRFPPGLTTPEKDGACLSLHQSLGKPLPEVPRGSPSRLMGQRWVPDPSLCQSLSGDKTAQLGSDKSVPPWGWTGQGHACSRVPPSQRQGWECCAVGSDSVQHPSLTSSGPHSPPSSRHQACLCPTAAPTPAGPQQVLTLILFLDPWLWFQSLGRLQGGWESKGLHSLCGD